MSALGSQLLERSSAVAALEAQVEAAAGGRGSVVLIEGAAGIGKTSVLSRAREIVAARGGDVRFAQAGPLERGLGWNLVRQLFADVVRADDATRARLLRGANELAGSALGLAGGSDEGALHGLYWLTADLAAERGPVLLAVDDAHWADAASLRFLAYLARRIDDLAVIVVLTARPGESDDEALAAIAVEPATTVVGLGELSPAGSAELTRATLGGQASAELCGACHSATSGNPFLLRELLGQLSRDGIDAAAASTANVDGVRPETVTRGVLLRLSRLSPDARALADAVAILGDGAALVHVAALAGLDDERALAAVESLTAADILRPAPLGFVHPIVHRTIEAELAPARLARDHTAAARILAGARADRERIALHLLHAEPAGDPWVVGLLRDAARDALASGAADAACGYLRRALGEPPDGDTRAAVLFELGVAEARGDLGGTDHMRAALELTTDPRARAETALALGHTIGLAGDHAGAADVLEAALDEPHDDPLLRSWIAAELAGHCLHAAAKLPLGFVLLSAVTLNGESTDPAGHRLRLIAAHGLMGQLPFEQARQVALQAAAGYEPSALDDLSTVLFVAELLVYVDEFDEAIAVLDARIAEARGHGSLPGVALASAFRAQAGLRRGTVAEAEADARLALEVLDFEVLGYSRSYVLSFLIDVLVEIGELHEAQQLLALAGPPGDWPALWQNALLLGSAGRLKMAQGATAQAADTLMACGAMFAPWRVRNPSTSPWRSDAALPLAALGRHDEARELARAELDDARAIAAPRALGSVLRVCGLVERGDEGLVLLREAVAVLEGSASRLEHARALVDLGAALRRSGARADAREPLREGLTVAQRCGARALASRAWDELVAAGGRPRGDADTSAELLTPSELRVARLAAEGRTNREIAQALFVSLRTVETHLTHVYRKLDLESRAALPGALAATGS